MSMAMIRDLYEYPDGRLLMVASDRVSAYDFVLTPEIPDKGTILTELSLWWFKQLDDVAEGQPENRIPADTDDGRLAHAGCGQRRRDLVSERSAARYQADRPR